MCGIAGIFHNQATSGELENKLYSILLLMEHRGFSRYETSSGPGWLLGTNRLEIIDRENGHQPKFSNDETIAAVLNGEIYNYLDLKQQLIENGYTFKSDTDTEVVANGYHFWGCELFSMLDGMFAILIWDKTNITFIAARDPLGVKPLYSLKSDSQLYFASEIKALLGTSKDIQLFPPGHYVVGNNKPVKYFNYGKIDICSSVADNAKVLRGLIKESVAKRVQTDLPVAVFLSGGIDSSAILYEAIQLHKDVTAFSVGDSTAEDVLSAKRLCEHLDVKFQHVAASADELLNVIPEVIKTIESFEPNHIRGGSLSYILSREVAQKGYRIALCGEGADELFGGYREFTVALQRGENTGHINMMFNRFISELHKTQLQRVDRTSMKFTLEVREPFLDKRILDFSHSLPIDQKIKLSQNVDYRNKIVLREAYRGLLPDWVVEREKVVFSLGAGFGSNGPEGIFYEHGKNMVNMDELEQLSQSFPDYSLKNCEEAFYFKHFLSYFGELNIAKERPLVNATASVSS